MRTKHLVMVGLLAAPLAAWPQASARTESHDAANAAKQDAKEAGRDVKAGAQDTGRAAGAKADQAGASAREAGRDAQSKADEARADAHARTDDAKASADAKHGAFAKADNWSVKGKVSSVGKDSITIRRDDDKLPAAKLDVDASTKVELDGKQASLSQLQQGADVKASFNLREDKPVAVEIQAKKTDTQKQAQDRREQQRQK